MQVTRQASWWMAIRSQRPSCPIILEITTDVGTRFCCGRHARRGYPPVTELRIVRGHTTLTEKASTAHHPHVATTTHLANSSAAKCLDWLMPCFEVRGEKRFAGRRG